MKNTPFPVENGPTHAFETTKYTKKQTSTDNYLKINDKRIFSPGTDSNLTRPKEESKQLSTTPHYSNLLVLNYNLNEINSTSPIESNKAINLKKTNNQYISLQFQHSE